MSRQTSDDSKSLAFRPSIVVSVIRRFFADSAIYGAAAIASQGIGLLLFPFLAHRFTPGQYGVIDILTLASILVNLTIALEVNQGLGRYFVDATEQDRIAYASTALIFTVGVYSVFAAIALALAAPLTDVLLGNGVDPTVTRVAVAWMWLNGIVYLCQDQLRWRALPRAFALAAVATAAATASTTAILVFALDVGVVGVFVGLLSGAAAAAAVIAAFSRGAYALRFDRRKLGLMLTFSLPLVPGSIGVFLNGFADRIVLQHSRSLADVGVYGVAFRIAAIATLLLAGFQGAASPLILSRHDEPQTRVELSHIFRLFSAIALSAFVFASVFADIAVRILASPAYGQASVIVPYLFMAALLFGVYIFAPGLTIAKRTATFAAISVSAGLLNLILALMLVPPLGIRGAGIATVLSSAWFFVLTIYFSQRHYVVKHDWARLGVALVVAVGVVVFGATAIESGQSAVFAAGPLLTRSAITVFGVSLIAIILIERAEFKIAWSQLRRLTSRHAQGSLS